MVEFFRFGRKLNLYLNKVQQIQPLARPRIPEEMKNTCDSLNRKYF